MTRGDRHRVLDMQEAADDLSAIVERGRSAWSDDEFDPSLRSYDDNLVVFAELA